MDKRYKLILSNNRFFLEAALPENASRYSVGTGINCECRFAKERFFTDFELIFTPYEETWAVSAKGAVYLSSDGVVKLHSFRFSHGDELKVYYQSSNQLMFTVGFMLDFEAENANYEKIIDIGDRSTISLGQDRHCDICLSDPLLGHDVVKLERRGPSLFVVDPGTRYGVYVNGVRIQREEEISDYDFFSILGFSFFYNQGELYTSKHTPLYPNELTCYEVSEQNNSFVYPRFNRNTRTILHIPDEPISVLDPPAKPKKPEQNIVQSLLPSLGMIALVVVLRGMMGGGNMSFILYSAASMGLGVVTTIMSFVNGKKNFKKETEQREKEYNAYLDAKKDEINSARSEERSILEEIYYSPETEEKFVRDFDGALFDRTPESTDFLEVRIGSGTMEAIRKIDYKAKEQISVDDPMTEYPQQICKEYRYIKDVPIVIPLRDANAVGVVGSEGCLVDIAKQMILDICTRQYHEDISLFLISDEEMPGLDWVRWLPSFNNSIADARGIATDAESRDALLEYLYSEITARLEKGGRIPHLIVFAHCSESFKRHPISRYIKDASKRGMTFIFLENHRERLPQYCSSILTLDSSGYRGTLTDTSGEKEETVFRYSPVSDASAEFMAERLSPVYCEEISLESTLTRSISFYQMLGILSAEDIDLKKNWATAQIVDTMSAPIGVRRGNELIYLDLHEKAHGPHGLVAGTTGSGKSETLQAYILSMAVFYHPYEVGFVIIDFKGGGMANQFRNLPHLIGTITNIDGREIDRSLKSIKAELQKRQRVFAEANVNSISNYIKKFKAGEVSEPLPHLIIVVDEFAELKAEQPEFMKELISAARIGRSLGVHLILATQKPSGQVNEQIWSNSRFKLCLKVQNAQDSNEVLKSPLAAEIREAGRGYLQVGNNEIFELFQSAYSGAPSEMTDIGSQKEYTISTVSLSGRREKVFEQKKQRSSGGSSETQLDAVVDYIGKYCEQNGITALSPICLPSLEDVIAYVPVEPEGRETYPVPMGIYDDPDNQYQGLAVISLSGENMLIVGSSQTGKTNLLQVIIRTLSEHYTPEEVSIYIADFGAMSLRTFEKLNHVGGVVTASEDERFKNLFKLLTEELESRKEKLAESGLSSFRAYCEAGYTDIPMMVFMLDNFSVFKELYADEYEGTLQHLLREGPAFGISTIITNAQGSSMGFRYMSNISQRVALTCNDRGEYSSILDRCRMEPKNVPGRALFAKDKSIFEFQSFLSFDGEKEIDRVDNIRSYIEEINAANEGMEAKPIPSIPPMVSIHYIRQNYPSISISENIAVGMDYATIEPVVLNAYTQLVFAVTGKNSSGAANFVKTLLADIRTNIFARPVELRIIDNFRKELAAYRDLPFTESYSTGTESLLEVIESVSDTLQERYDELQDEGPEALERMPWIIVLVNNKQALDNMAGSRTHENMFTDICKKYSNLKILFLLTEVGDAAVNSSSPQLLRKVKDDKKLLYFGALKEMKIIDLYGSATRNIGNLVDADDAYLLNGENVHRIKTIQEV